jgi:hypothetical protein
MIGNVTQQCRIWWHFMCVIAHAQEHHEICVMRSLLSPMSLFSFSGPRSSSPAAAAGRLACAWLGPRSLPFCRATKMQAVDARSGDFSNFARTPCLASARSRRVRSEPARLTGCKRGVEFCSRGRGVQAVRKSNVVRRCASAGFLPSHPMPRGSSTLFSYTAHMRNVRHDPR